MDGEKPHVTAMNILNGTALMDVTAFFIISVLLGTARMDETALVNIINVTNGTAWMARRHLWVP